MNTPALPAYLQSRQSQRVAEGAADGIGGSLPPHISIRGNNFTLVDAAGNKADVPTKYLDVCFVDRSEVVCKQYYENDFVDGADDPPTCWSANGVAPSIEATKPQAATCAVCDWNARGSDVSKLSGKPIKACRDEKWTAVILPLYPTMVFQFKVTPGSFKAWKGYTDKFKGQQTDLSDVVTRLAFEKDKNGVLTFEAISYIDEALFKAREQAVIEKKTDVLVGRNDRPIQGALAGPRQEENRPLPASTAGGQTATPSFVSQGQPSGTLTPPATHTAPAEGFAHTASPTEPARRRRRTKAEIEADNARDRATNPAGAGQGAQFGGGNAGPAPFRPVDPPANAGAPFGIATQAVPPDPAMKGMLDNIFGSPPRSAG
jgi:hypothetical protein